MKRILVISHKCTPPIYEGNQRCIYGYCDLLRSNGVDVHFLYVQGRERISATDLHVAKTYWGNSFHLFNRRFLLDAIPIGIAIIMSRFIGTYRVDDRYPRGLTHYVKKLQKEYCFDGIIINYLLFAKLFKSKINAKKIVYTHDVLSYKSRRNDMKKFWLNLSPNEEAKGLERADVILSIQENESIYFKYLCPNKPVYTVYTDFKVSEKRIAGNKNIVFLSGKSILNQNGIRYFVKNVYPRVLQYVPEAKLYVGGSICDYIKDLESEKIILVGRVEEEAGFYGLANVAINPIYQGTGLKIKTFEALSYGMVTVVHPHSTEGIYEKEKAPVLVGHTDEEFAKHIIRALTDELFCKEMSQRSIEYIQAMSTEISNIFMQVIEA